MDSNRLFGYLLKYNVNTGESELHKNGVDKYVYTYITADENRLYLLIILTILLQ